MHQAAKVQVIARSLWYHRSALAALQHLKRCNDEHLVFDGDTRALFGFKAGGLDP
jgi:hypothetical protein